MDKAIFTSRWRAALILILLLAAFLRLFDLGTQSIWRDEAVTIMLTHDSVSQIVQNRANDNHVPLYFIFLRGWVALFGDSETSVRFPSAIFGIVGVYLAFRLGRILRDRSTGLIASFALSLSLINIMHSREARMYSLLVMLVLFSMIAFIRLQRERSSALVTGYIVSTVLMLYTQPYALFFLAVQIAYILYRIIFRGVRGKPVRSWAALFGATAAAFVPWAFVLVGQLERRQATEASDWIQTPTIGTLVRSFGTFANSSVVLLSLFFLLSLCTLWVMLSRAGVVSLPAQLSGESVEEAKTAMDSIDILVLLVGWILLPLVTPVILSQFMAPFFRPRYAIAVTPAILVVVAWGISSLRPKMARYGAILLLALFSVLPLVSYLRGALQMPFWKQAVAYINTHASPGETVLVYQSEFTMGMFEYYPLDSTLNIETYSARFSAQDARAIVENEKPKRFIFVKDGIEGKKWDGIFNAFESAYTVDTKKSYQSGVLLLVYQRRAGA